MASIAAMPLAQAGPTGGQVSGGKGTITQSGSTTTIQQSTQNLFLNWQSFNVAPRETVDFLQPSATAIAVNRIVGSNGSQILGHLNANGQVWLINPNGVVFGRGAEVNVGGLVASALAVSDTSAGSASVFSGAGTGMVVNEGTITTLSGGYVALLGNHVSNQGTISARLGTVALGAGSAATLTFAADSLVKMQVDQSTLNALAANGGVIQADGGQVLMSAGAQTTLLASVVNNTGVIEARTVDSHEGSITLLGGMTAGTVTVGGTLDAGAPQSGNGGSIETSAAHVEVANAARITTMAPHGLTGSWLVDPQDFTVAASGGDITGATLSSELGSTSVTLRSSSGANTGSGNVNVNDAVSWAANTRLTLTASNDVDINDTITATGARVGVALNPNTANGTEAASGTGTFLLGAGASINLPLVSPSSTTALTIGGTSYTVINSLGVANSLTGTDLQGIEGDPSGHFALGRNIDASSTGSWNSGAGFTPIGTGLTPFIGTFDGLGHSINGLVINRPTTPYVGLFGEIFGLTAKVSDVGLVGGRVSGAAYVGALVGYDYGGFINNSYATGAVTGSSKADYVGGLVGAVVGGVALATQYGTVSNSYATGKVIGGAYVGGLVGYSDRTTISNSHATGNVHGGFGSGGLVGYGFETPINNSYASGDVVGANGVGGLIGSSRYDGISASTATGTVTGLNYVGGLVGIMPLSTIDNSYASGRVSGATQVGGLVGLEINGSVSNSYARGAVSGESSVGGLVGYVYGGSINTSYSTGRVVGATSVGGLVGSSFYGATVTNSFWNTTTSGQSTSAGGIGMTTAQMQQQSNFTSATSANDNVNPGWDFTDTWVMYNGHTYPLLKTSLAPTVAGTSNEVTSGGAAYSGGLGSNLDPELKHRPADSGSERD